jgi:hypothetical protein
VHGYNLYRTGSPGDAPGFLTFLLRLGCYCTSARFPRSSAGRVEHRVDRYVKMKNMGSIASGFWLECF